MKNQNGPAGKYHFLGPFYFSTMSKMKLIDGKFYLDEMVVPIEFGNQDQINLMRSREELIEAYKDDGIMLDCAGLILGGPDRQECACGRDLFIPGMPENYEQEEGEEIDWGWLIKLPIRCSCGKRYKIYDCVWGLALKFK